MRLNIFPDFCNTYFLYNNLILLFLSYDSEYIRDTAIEVKTPPLRKIGDNGFLQCTALSKRSDAITNMNDTYLIHVDSKL